MKKIITGIAAMSMLLAGGAALAGCGEQATMVGSEQAFIEALEKGGTVKLDGDIELTKTLKVDKKVVLDLNGKNLTENISDGNSISMFWVSAGGDLRVKGDGSATSDDKYIFCVEGSKTGDDAKLVVEGGNYTDYCSIVSVNYGEAEVKGGEYKVTRPEYEKYTLNLLDKSGKDGTAKIVVTGGKFTKYNPAESNSESPAVNFVADGYKSTKDGDIYTVTKQ